MSSNQLQYMMDSSYVQSWLSQPDVCRCCLSASGTRDVTSTYLSDTGEKEVYSELLQECYGITLSFLLQWGPRMLCTLCASHLQSANNFRKQVLRADHDYVTYYNKLSGTVGLTDTADAPVVSRVDVKEPKPLKNVLSSNEDEDSDSNTPISQIVAKESSGHRSDDIKQDDVTEPEAQVRQSFVYKKLQKVTRQVSERKRVILTCGIVLKDTNACPFRHHKSWFQCFFCQQEYMEINLLRNHNLTTHSNVEDELRKIKRYPRSLQIDITNLECRHCNLKLTDVSSMCRHFVDVHKKVIYSECIADYKVNGSPYSCHLCGQIFHVFRSLTTHLNEHYANCICDVCGKSFLNSKRLKVHKRTHENGQYPCKECGKVLRTKTSKANHIESVHSKRVIKCQICYKPMKHYNDRIKHMSEVHNITHNFKCHICSREYKIKHYLATHIRQTHGHKDKKCLECDMAFITNHGLKKHMLKHTGAKAYTCNVCCKSYARSYTLREHMRAHDNQVYIAPE